MRRFSEHFRIEKYLRNKSLKGIKPNTLKTNENILSLFPIGLIIITKDIFEDKLELINKYACKLFNLNDNCTLNELMEKFKEYVKLKNKSVKTNKTLKDIISNYSPSNQLDNFIPFESTYSKSIILYIKINEVENEKYIVIDKYDNFIEERNYIELNLIKSINYQYLHTLYHELNNPLNALLALAGENEKTQLYSSEISNSRIDNKPSFKQKKSKRINNNFTSNYKSNKSNGFINLNNNRLSLNPDIFDFKLRKRTFGGDDLYNKIPLLVNIIKIFIKNFILYLKTRADNLIMLKNEFKMQNETSDIMNAVEVSEYEKELTKHRLVKINLQYIFDLYFEKYLCLFKYKEIEFETNFDKLKNFYIITDEFNFIYYIRQIYTYLYYIIPKKEGFQFNYKEDKENNKIKIIIKKINNGNITKRTDEQHNKHKENKENKESKDNISDMSQVIQTKEMTKEVLYSMSKKLNFNLEIYDVENNEHSNNNNPKNIYLCITIPIQRKDKYDEADDFKDEDINEMVQKDLMLLEDKLKREFPIYNSIIDKSNNLVNDIPEISSKIEKECNESSIHLAKNENILSINSNKNILKKECKNLQNSNSNKESPKKDINLNTNKSSNKFLNKCLGIENNNEKEKLNKNVKIKNNRKKSNYYIHLNNVRGHIMNYSSHKNIFYNDLSQKNEIKTKNRQLSGIFTKINNFGLSEEIDLNDVSISNSVIKKNYKNNIIYKNKNILSEEVQENNNKPTSSLISLDLNQKIDNYTDMKHSTKDKNKKIKTAYIITDNSKGKNKHINININNNNIINIINENSLQKDKFKNNIKINKVENKPYKLALKSQKNLFTNSSKLMSSKKGDFIQLSEIEQNQKKRLSQNVSPKINPKDCMTFFGGEKKENTSKGKNTPLNESLKQSDNLFLEASKERELSLQKSEKISNQLSKQLLLSSQFDEEENEEIEDSNDCISEEKDLEEESQICNCIDILIVDDEEFNVMASQKIVKNLGFESDVAYNGEECINLIKEKEQLHCNCNKNYYKLIFLDIVMPVLDGIKTAKKIQEMIDNKEINENIQIIFVSGNIDGNELKESLLKICCVKECLQKPVRLDKYQKIFEKYYKNN